MFFINLWFVLVLVGAVSIAFPSLCPSPRASNKKWTDFRKFTVNNSSNTGYNLRRAHTEISQSLTLQFWQKGSVVKVTQSLYALVLMLRWPTGKSIFQYWNADYTCDGDRLRMGDIIWAICWTWWCSCCPRTGYLSSFKSF